MSWSLVEDPDETFEVGLGSVCRNSQSVQGAAEGERIRREVVDWTGATEGDRIPAGIAELWRICTSTTPPTPLRPAR